MKIDVLKQLSYEELQSAYASFLKEQNLSKNTISTSKSDAFYLLKYDDSIDFWELLLRDDFEIAAKTHLKATLMRTSSGNVNANLNGYMSHLRRFRKFVFSDDNTLYPKTDTPKVAMKKTLPIIPTPCKTEVEYYLHQWDQLESYRLQEDALDKLFLDYAPNNNEISDILLKAATLNDFYSTNIFSIFPVAKHIQALNIDQRLQNGDVSLVDDIKDVNINGKTRHLYSFATKYCSHHNSDQYPIYDRYVEEVLTYFRKKDHFATFTSQDLKNYSRFKSLLIEFQNYYSLQEYSLKQLDQYLWQLGKQYFPKQYK